VGGSGANNHHQTLYGRELVVTVVTVVSEEGGAAEDRWFEEKYDPEANAGRRQIMQAVWEQGRLRGH
jgi:hypothetical protein